MSGAIQASTSATSGANAANPGLGLPSWALVALACVAALIVVKVVR